MCSVVSVTMKSEYELVSDVVLGTLSQGILLKNLRRVSKCTIANIDSETKLHVECIHGPVHLVVLMLDVCYASYVSKGSIHFQNSAMLS